MNILQATLVADEVVDLYKKFGDKEYIGEDISQMQHMLQCGLLAQQQGCDNEVILAAFLHDIGHLCINIMPAETMGQWGVKQHEVIGANYLKVKGFSDRVVAMVQSHVQAKRYLTYKFSEYYHQLSTASKATLALQGGPMTLEEAFRFESMPDAEWYVKLRQWDDEGKQLGQVEEDFDFYRKLIIQHLTQ